MATTHLNSISNKARLNRGRLVTYCPISSESFVLNQARALAPAIRTFFGDHPFKANIRSYTPPYSVSESKVEVSDFLIGFLSLDFSPIPKDDHIDEDLTLSIGVEFGHQTKERKLFRDGADIRKILDDPSNPQSGNLIAVNFDEAWRLICCLLSQVEISEITIEYGL